MELASPLVLPVVDRVKLIQIQRGVRRVFTREDIDNIFCLELGGDQFSIQEAIDWVHTAHDVDPNDSDIRVPTIVVLGDARALSVEELDRVTEELIPAGAIFAAWPTGCKSFEQAFKALATRIARNYGPSDFSNAGSWGRRQAIAG
jgi:hypothetical protein